MRLAVLIPAFNPGADLPRTLASLATDLVPFDIVIVDDGSQPPVEVAQTAGDHRIVLLRLPVNHGVARALNAGVGWVLEREYDYLARLDAGDMNEAGRLARQVEYLDRHTDLALIGTWARHVDERLQPLYVTRYPATWTAIRRRFHYRTAFCHSACTIRTSVLRETGAYDQRFALAEDYELFWRIALRHPCANIPDVLVTRVEDQRSLTHRHRGAMARLRLALQWRHFAWHRPDCWLGIARSFILLLIPARLVLTVKRAIGTVG